MWETNPVNSTDHPGAHGKGAADLAEQGLTYYEYYLG